MAIGLLPAKDSLMLHYMVLLMILPQLLVLQVEFVVYQIVHKYGKASNMVKWSHTGLLMIAVFPPVLVTPARNCAGEHSKSLSIEVVTEKLP